MKKVKIFLAMPAYKGVHPATYAALERHLDHDVAEYALYFHEKNPIIDLARMYCLAAYLRDPRGPYDYYMQLDSDVWWRPGSIKTLLEHNVDAITGIYPYKTSDEVNAGNPVLEAMPGEWRGDLVKLRYAPGGFFLLKANTLARMMILRKAEVCDMDAGGAEMAISYHFWQGVKVHWRDPSGRPWRRYLPEDYAFSWRIAQSGFDIWASRRVVLRHCGPDQDYQELAQSDDPLSYFQVKSVSPLKEKI